MEQVSSEEFFYEEESDALGLARFRERYADALPMRDTDSAYEKNFIYLDAAKEMELGKLLSHRAEPDFSQHKYGRLNMFRKKIMPWLDNLKPLKARKYLKSGAERELPHLL